MAMTRNSLIALAFAVGLIACDQPAQPPVAPKAPEAPAAPVPPVPPAAPAAPAAAQVEQPYVWHEAIPGQSVQFGVPDTDDRGLRIDCDRGGRIAIMGPTGLMAPEGGSVTVLLQTPGEPERQLPGQVVEMGDGANFRTLVTPDDRGLTGLLTGKGLTVGSAGDSWAVPSDGVRGPLTRLLAACAAQKD